jgi:diguanylate cyclase (GGDEF)-like protein/PAS domain S-box-containing protein
VYLSPIDASLTQADLDAVEDAIGRAAFAADGTILRVNARFLDLYGYAGRDLAGRNRTILLEPGRGEADIVDDVFASGEPRSADVRQVRRDGSPFWVEASFYPVRDAEGTVAEVVLLVRDATQRRLAAARDSGQIDAINASQAVIHFAVDGTILDANPRFLACTGYALDEIVGRHHRIFVDPAEGGSADYDKFWSRLREGTHASGEFRRLRADGTALWLRATYNPIFDLDGRPCRIVEYALDITDEKHRQADYQGQVAAIDKAQCVATFAMDGTIIVANARFLNAVGYTAAEIEGRHHRIFVEPAHAHSLDYEMFWKKLAAGEHRSGEFRRIGKDGQECWFRSTYSPIFDHDGKPFKIVNYATVITHEKLRQADHQGQIAAIHRSQAVVSFTIDGEILDANDNFLELTGYRLSQVRGRHHRLFVAPDEHDGEAYAEFWRDLAAGNYRSGEVKRICRDGREIWLQASYNPIFDMNGRPFKIVKNAVDVTAQKLRQHDHEGQIAAIDKAQCVAAFDLDGTILSANDNFLALLGYSLDEVAGRHHRLFADRATAESAAYHEFWGALCAGQHRSARSRRIARDGSEVWVQATYNPICDFNGRPFKIVEIASDVTADVALAADLARAQREVQHDLATGLPNRLGLRLFMRGALAETGSELSLLYLDLDHFKPINDTFGHDVGDHVLRTVAKRLQLALTADQIVARIGGDEFVVAVSQRPREEVARLGERLIEIVSEPIVHGDRELQVGLSIGIASIPHDTLDDDELFRLADVALYRSKGNQRGTLTFYGERHAEVAEDERHLPQELRISVKARHFTLACTDFATETPDTPPMIEVWPEWAHPTRGLLTHDRFMRVADQSGLIVPLGDWMIREACLIAASAAGAIVSVPIYPRQLLSSDLPETLALALREAKLDPQRIEFRLQQGTTRVNVNSLKAELTRLAAMGIRVAGDGFLLGDEALAAPATWPVAWIAADDRLLDRLRRRPEPLAQAMFGAAASRRDALSPTDRLRLRIDRQGHVRGFVARTA